MDVTGVFNLLQAFADVHFKMLELGDLQGRPASQAALLFFRFGPAVPAYASHSVSDVSDQQYPYLYPHAPAPAGRAGPRALPDHGVAFIHYCQPDQRGRISE